MIIDDHPIGRTPKVRSAREPAKPARRPRAGASQRQAGATAMVILYTPEEWIPIRAVFLDALGLHADELQIPTPRFREENVYVMYSLRSRLEAAASMYLTRSVAKRYSLRPDELIALRQKVESCRVEIHDALAIPIPSKHLEIRIISPGVDVSMLTEIDDYFRKLLLTLDRLSEQAGPRSGNARKTARDHCWNELLAIWCELGGETTGEAAANFLIAATKPVMRSAVPSLASVLRWLRRRQNKTGNKVSKPSSVGTPSSAGSHHHRTNKPHFVASKVRRVC